MNVLNVVEIALFVPFVALIVIFGSVFAVSGYKNGFWRSLVSLGTTVAAIIVGMLLSKLLGRLLSGPVLGLIPSGAFAEAGAMKHLVESVVQAIIQVVITLILFGLFFVIGVIVLKALGKRLRWEKVKNEHEDRKGLRFAGMGIRALDAVIVTFALLLPLYGTISFAVPPVARMADMVVTESNTMVEILDTVENHPVVKAYGTGPAAAVYNGLSTFNMGEESFDPMAMTEAIEGTSSRFMVFSEADGEQRVAALTDLIQFVRSNVIEEDWCYELVCVLRTEMEKIDEPEAQQILKLTDMSKEEFKSNGTALLDFVDYALNSGFMTFYASSDYEALSPEFYEKLGSLINYSEQAVAFKKLLMKESAATMLRSGWEEEDYAAAMVKADAFIEQCISDDATEATQQKQEAEMFMRLAFEDKRCNILEAFAHHPSVSYAEVKDFLNEDMLKSMYYYESADNVDAKLIPALQAKLATYGTAPLSNLTFEDYIEAVISISSVLNGNEHYGFTANDALLADLVDHLGDDFFQDRAVDGQKVKQLLNQALEEAKQKPGTYGMVDLYGALSEEADQVFGAHGQNIYEDVFGGSVIIGSGDGSVAVLPDMDADADLSGGFIVQTNPDGTITIIEGTTP